MSSRARIVCVVAIVVSAVGCKKKPKPAPVADAAVTAVASDAGTASAASVTVGDCHRPVFAGWGDTGTGTGTGFGVGGKAGEFKPHATAKIGAITVTGELDKVVVHRVLRRGHASLLACYDDQRKKSEALDRGTSTAKFTIEDSGKVKRAEVSGFEPKVDACVQKLLTSTEFPKPTSGSAAVELPIRFELISKQLTADSDVPVPPELLPAAKTAVSASTAALSECYAAGVATTPGLAGSAIVTIGADDMLGQVHAWGLGNAAVEDCIADALKEVAKDVVSAECELTLGAAAALRPTLRADALVIDVDATQAKSGDSKLADVSALLASRGAEVSLAKLAKGVLALSKRQQLLIRATPDAPAKAVEILLELGRKAGYQDVLVALGPDLLPGMLPPRLLPGPGVAEAKVLVENNGFVVFVSSIAKQPAKDATELTAALADARSRLMKDRTDLVIMAEDGVLFSRLAEAYRAASAAGFNTIQLLPNKLNPK